MVQTGEDSGICCYRTKQLCNPCSPNTDPNTPEHNRTASGKQLLQDQKNSPWSLACVHTYIMCVLQPKGPWCLALTICFCFNGFTEKLPSTCCRGKTQLILNWAPPSILAQPGEGQPTFMAENKKKVKDKSQATMFSYEASPLPSTVPGTAFSNLPIEPNYPRGFQHAQIEAAQPHPDIGKPLPKIQKQYSCSKWEYTKDLGHGLIRKIT